MPANLPPDYFAAEKRFREAKSIDEKIAILEEMIAIMPKHKGTDRLFGDLKRKMAKLKESKETQRKSGKKEHWQVEKEGAGQAVLVGPPNSGKSSILRALTNARPQIAEYPFTTRAPTPGMMLYEDIQIQLVELPAVTRDVIESWVPNAIFSADILIIVLDLSTNTILDDALAVFEQIEKRRIKIVSDIPKEPEAGYRYMRTIIIANKHDAAGADDKLEILNDWSANRILVLPFTAINPEGYKNIPGEIYKALKIIRVYPKRPGKKAEKKDPLVLREGATVIEAAGALHKDIAAKLKFARGWGAGTYDGQHLAMDFVLKDGFVLEFH